MIRGRRAGNGAHRTRGWSPGAEPTPPDVSPPAWAAGRDTQEQLAVNRARGRPPGQEQQLATADWGLTWSVTTCAAMWLNTWTLQAGVLVDETSGRSAAPGLGHERQGCGGRLRQASSRTARRSPVIDVTAIFSLPYALVRRSCEVRPKTDSLFSAWGVPVHITYVLSSRTMMARCGMPFSRRCLAFPITNPASGRGSRLVKAGARP